MDNVLDKAWTTETFLAWEDKQEGKYEFDGRDIVPMTGGSIAHQQIVFNLMTLLTRLLAGKPLRALHEMRLRAGTRIRYPDVVVFAGPLEQTTRTLSDAVAAFEVLSDDTAKVDRVDKLADYAAVPSMRVYVLLEQTAIAATVFRRGPDRTWTASPHTGGDLSLPEIGAILPLAEAYAGLTLPAQ